MEIIHKELSHRIIGCIFDLFREIGPGFDEFTYHQALRIHLIKEKITFKNQPHIYIYYKKFQVADLIPDFIIDNKIILELKAIQTKFLPENYTQMISYLRATEIHLGILVNFGLHKVFFDRVPFHEKPLKITEDFNELNLAQNKHKELTSEIRAAIIKVANELRLGYHTKIYQTATRFQL